MPVRAFPFLRPIVLMHHFVPVPLLLYWTFKETEKRRGVGGGGTKPSHPTNKALSVRPDAVKSLTFCLPQFIFYFFPFLSSGRVATFFPGVVAERVVGWLPQLFSALEWLVLVRIRFGEEHEYE